MLSTVRDAWKIPELRKKMLFTLMVIFVFRIGSAIPVPYMDKRLVAQMFAEGSGTVLQLLDMISGGGLERFTIFAMGVSPYITASIVIQLLTFAIPALEELQKEGEEGRKKIQFYQRILAILIALIQSIGFTYGLFKGALYAETFLQNSIVILSMVAGTCFVIWLGEQITKNGVGNGISIIIFLGIISRIPNDLIGIFNGAKAGTIGILPIVVFSILAALVVLFVVALNEGERRIQVQYSKRVVGRKMYGGQNTHIPIKVSMAGVMPVIFSSSILAIPATIAQFNQGSGFANFLLNWFTPQGIPGTIIYSVLNIVFIMFFTYFYTAMQFNTVEYSKNLQQNGGFIPGIRPGRPTSEYLEKVVNRLVFVGGLGLALLSSLPIILGKFMAVPMVFAGTSIIIVVGVVLETLRSLEQQMIIRHYKGFLN
ncbi:MAG: preprotein translocase subunit SecY [Tissierellia bacterium]|nr:preprotein translocase subunit SecY [Tissierellia bacterium]